MTVSLSQRIRFTGAALVAVSAVAFASVTFDPATGIGFVGKGDIQTLYGWNNAVAQSNAGNLRFRYQSTEVATWNCEKIVILGNGDEHDIIQVRTNITNTEGVVSGIARVKTQVTGFSLGGYSSLSITVNGPAIGSCPSDHSTFVEGTVAFTQTGGNLQVTTDGSVWNSL